ncbi:MAG: adenosine deaminase family protein [Bacteriovoracaceae bacterium]|jgi:adenosine deaminase|nr:adenosine deaminase family protein [Bacteriovoracaceae bacterium]
MKYTDEFLKKMPKSDLHLHLDGSLRLDTLIEAAKKLNIDMPSYEQEGLKEKVFKDKYTSLGEYLTGFQYTCAALRDLEILERASYELAIDNQNEGVNYIEVRYAPQLLMDPIKGIDLEMVIKRVHEGLDRAKKEYNNKKEVKDGDLPKFDYGIICCAMRNFGPEFSPYYNNFINVMPHMKKTHMMAHAAMELTRGAVRLKDKGYPIVAIDLAGEESGYPAINFKEAYDYAHRNFLGKTVHAGEAYGAESIFQAITLCYADRIGHGYSLFDPDLVVHRKIEDKQKYINDLSSYIADKRVTIEVCLTSNLQTNPEIKDIKDHPFKHMIENRIATTICTDNRLVSNTTMTNEFSLAVNNFEIPIKRLKDIVAYGFKKSFYPGTYVEKRQYAKDVMNYFDKITNEFELSSNS